MWKEDNNLLKASFTFKDFSTAFSFMTQVAILAEKQNHHPFWSNVYNQVNFELCTHDAGNVVTEKDRDLANGIDEIFAQYRS